MRRPRWIAALLLALAIAAGFAALGQWQLSRSFERAVVPDQQTENVVQLSSVAEPQVPVLARATGQRVSFDARFIPADYTVLTGRVNLSDAGYWVVGHAVLTNGPSVGSSITVALGWVNTSDAAASAIRGLQANPPAPTITGRYLPSESPQDNAFEHGANSTLAVPDLINRWSTPPQGVFGGYIVSHDAVPGLEKIDSPAPSTEVSLNLLNVFYAIEWVIFAGFAIFLWYRLARDAWEAEVAEVAEIANVE
jgi:surfeit locus 1 family protein